MAEGRVQAAQKQVGRGKLGFQVGWARVRNWALAGQGWFWFRDRVRPETGLVGLGSVNLV